MGDSKFYFPTVNASYLSICFSIVISVYVYTVDSLLQAAVESGLFFFPSPLYAAELLEHLLFLKPVGLLF